MQRDLIAEGRSALARYGIEGATIETLSPPSFGRKSERCTLKVHLANGAVIKARCLETVEAAARLTDLRRRLHASYVPVLARYDTVLLEPWIEGETLSPALAETRAEEVGALLGRLHATALAEPQETVPTRERREQALAHLDSLADTGVMAPGLHQALRAELVRSDPGTAPVTVVHMDYCPENLVVDPHGALHVVDNEWIHLDASGVDLGRTYSRWPMPADVWSRFLRGYATTAPFHEGPLRFWMIVMAAAGAAVRLHKSAAELAVPLARLRQLGAEVAESA